MSVNFNRGTIGVEISASQDELSENLRLWTSLFRCRLVSGRWCILRNPEIRARESCEGYAGQTRNLRPELGQIHLHVILMNYWNFEMKMLNEKFATTKVCTTSAEQNSKLRKEVLCTLSHEYYCNHQCFQGFFVTNLKFYVKAVYMK